jgi:uncharacterized protein
LTRRSGRLADTRAFFATDIHGSDRCFRKFLNAAKFYRCSVLIMGGDMTGKMLVPIVDVGAGRYEARFPASDRIVEREALPRLRKAIANAGYYGYETTPEEIVAMEQDPAAVEQLFEAMMRETLTSWLTLASERLPSSTRCFMAPGNDDPFFVDGILDSSSAVVNPDGKVVEVADGFFMISVGYSNPTPWDTPREVPEGELLTMIEKQADELPDTGRAIFNLHVPPKDTPIDQAAVLDDDLRPVMRGGQPAIGGMGSSAVRDAIERRQPLLGLHGHIHESRGDVRVGRTVCLNPGSEYSEGVLRGVIVTLSTRKGLKGYQLVAG